MAKAAATAAAAAPVACSYCFASSAATSCAAAMVDRVETSADSLDRCSQMVSGRGVTTRAVHIITIIIIIILTSWC